MPEQLHDLESLAALVEGRLDAADRPRVLSHVADCAECRQTLAELGRARADGSLQDNRPGRGRYLSARVWLPVAASVLVGVVAWFQLDSWWPRPALVTDDAGPDATIPADQVSDDDLLRKRGGGRKVADKTFTMTGGAWVDAAFDPSIELPTVVVSGSEARTALLAREPQLAPFAALGSRVVVVWQGTVYRFGP